MVLACGLDAHDVADVLNDTDCVVVAAPVGTYRTLVGISYHHAGAAVVDVVSQSVDGLCEMVYVFRRLSQEMKGETESAARADARQGADCLNCFLQNL